MLLFGRYPSLSYRWPWVGATGGGGQKKNPWGVAVFPALGGGNKIFGPRGGARGEYKGKISAAKISPF